MSVIEKAISWALDVANDNSHGYDQASRWGRDYDCSSLVISAFEYAGTGVKSAGATYTGNMRSVFLKCGFKDVTSSVNLSTGAGLVRGDVLLNQVTHTALYLGNNQIVHAAGNEYGKATGGKVGDQTGGEICTRSYYNSPWDCILRYTGEATTVTTTEGSECEVKLNELSKGSKGNNVKALQILLIGYGYSCGSYGADGDFGTATLAAVKKFQAAKGLTADGIVGTNTWTKLLKG